MKAFADDKYNVAQIMHVFFDRVVNIVGKGENAGNQPAFSPLTTVFKRPFPQGCQKSSIIDLSLVVRENSQWLGGCAKDMCLKRNSRNTKIGALAKCYNVI